MCLAYGLMGLGFHGLSVRGFRVYGELDIGRIHRRFSLNPKP